MADIIDIDVFQTVTSVSFEVEPNTNIININKVTSSGGSGVTNLSTTQTATDFTINSDTGDDALVPLGNGTLAGATLNDYTTTEKNKLSGIAVGAEVNVNADWNAVSGDAQILNKPTIPSISGLATVTYVDTQDALKQNNITLTTTGTSGASTLVGATLNIPQYNGATNLTTSQTSTNFTINSSTGDDAVVPLGNGSNAGATLNDYTTVEKNKLAGIAVGAEVNVNADWNATSGDAQILNKPTISVDILTNPNTGISILDTTIDTIYNTALDSTLVMPNAVGGIASGTTVASLSSLNLVQIFNDLLFPTINPTYTIPAISLSSTVTSIREIGQTFSPVVTLTGTKNDAGLFSQLIIRKSINGGSAVALTTSSIATTSATAIANQFGYTDPNNPNFSYTVSTTDSGLVIPPPTSGSGSSTVSYSGLGDYTAGLAKKNNKGFNDLRTPAVRSVNAPQAAGTNFAPTSQNITGYYPYFYGKASTQKSASDIVSIIQSGIGFTQVINTATGSLSMAFNATGEFPWFATYSTYATKTTWFENALNNGSIGGATDLFAAPTTLSVVSSDGYWTTTFKIYPSNKVTTLGTATIA